MPIDQLDAADLDQTVAVQRIKPGGLGIEHDLAHESPAAGVASTRYELPARAAHFSDRLQNVAHLRAGMIEATANYPR